MEKVIKRLIISAILLLLFHNVESIFFSRDSPEIQEKKQILAMLQDIKKSLSMVNKKRNFSLSDIEQHLFAVSVEQFKQKTKEKLQLAKQIIIEEKKKNENFLQRSMNPKDKMFFLVKIDICDMALRILRGYKKSLGKEDVLDFDNCKIVDMAIFLGEKEEKIEKIFNYKLDIILVKFMNAIRQGVQVIIVSSPRFRSIFDFYNRFDTEKNDTKKNASSYHQRTLEGFIEDFKKKLSKKVLQLYTINQKGQQDFVVIVSKKTDEKLDDLKKLGLNPNLRAIQEKDIFNVLAQEIEMKNYVENIKNILYEPTSKFEKKNLPGKLIYLNEHGRPATMEREKERQFKVGTWAGIEKPYLSTFIDDLNRKKCLLLTISSCYSGGWNSLKMYTEKAHFPIVTSSAPDSISIGNKAYFPSFYRNIRDVICSKIKYAHWPSNKKFKEALSYIYGSYAQNIPAILLPGDMYFRYININDDFRAMQPHENGSIELTNEKAVLFFENVCNASFYGNIPALVSMIPGPAHHFLEGVNARVDFSSLIKKMVTVSAYPKMFFLEDIYCKSCKEFQAYPFQQALYSNLHIKNFYYETSKVVRSNDIFINGAGILKRLGVEDRFFKLTYRKDRENKNKLAVILITREDYFKGLIKALDNTVSKKEAMYAVNPKNKHLLLKIGKDSMYYHVDAMFLEKVNRCLKSESLPRIAVCGEKFEEDKEGNSQQTYMGYIKDGTKNKLRNILNSSPAYYTLPTVMRRSLMRYFVSEKESYYC